MKRKNFASADLTNMNEKAEPFITEDEMEDLEQCVSDMLCVQCGLELDARGTDCECMCHQMV